MPVTGDTELGPSKNDLIIEIVQKELAAKSMLLGSNTITDLSARVGKGMKSVSINKLASFVAQDRASAVAGVNQSLQGDVDTIQLDKRKHIQWTIDSNDEIESSIAVELENAKRASSGHARQFDIDGFAAMVAAASQTIQGAPVDVTRNNIIDMRMELMHQNADQSLMSYWASVDQYHNLLKIPEFSEVRLYGDQIIKSGLIGTLYGQPVFQTNILTAGQICLIEQQGLGFAFQRRPAMDERNAPEYGTGAKLKVMDQKYGFGGLELGVDSGKGAAPVGAAKSPLIVKLQP